MSDSKALRAAAGILLAEADRLDGKVSGPQQMTTYAGRSVTVAEAWAFMLEEFANGEKPHEWRPWVSGMHPSEVGDGDKPDDDFLRAFGPFMDAATRENQKDSTGARFFMPSVKARTGLGWEGVKSEVRRLWISDWGISWRANEENQKAGLVPKQAP